MEGSEISLVGVERGMQDMLHDSQSRDIVQHHGSNPGGTSEAHPVEEDEGSILVTQNPSLVSPVCCPQEVGVEPPGPEAGRDPCDSQQDLECNSNEEKTLGKEVLILMEALSTLPTPEEKLAVLCMKYADLVRNISNTQKQMKMLRWKQVHTIKEKVLLQIELIKVNLARGKLECFLSELQHDKHMLTEENMQQAREKGSRKKATSHVQITLNDIQAQLEQFEMYDTRLQWENIEFGEMIKKLSEQYTMRKKQIDVEIKHKKLQKQLIDAKLQQTIKLLQEASKKHKRERELSLKEAMEWRHRYEEMKHQEVQLKQQLSHYMDKFEELQTLVETRIEVFTSYRQEMGKMKKKIETLHRKRIIWRTKWESSSIVVLQMTEKKIIHDKELEMSDTKLKQLEKVFKALQRQRNELGEEVKALKEQLHMTAVGVNSATSGTQSSTASDPQKELNTSTQEGQKSSCTQSPSE